MIYLIKGKGRPPKEIHKPTVEKSGGGFFDFIFGKKDAEVLITPEPPREPLEPTRNAMGDSLYFIGEHPICESCNEPMNLIIQMQDKRVNNKAALVFQCADPLCSTWEPDGGANKVLFKDSIEEVTPELALEFVESTYTEEELQDHEMDDAIGKALGKPVWLQDDETPECCEAPMEFVFQVQDGDVVNFGDTGTGYVFKCKKCEKGKFLSQCF